MELAELADQIEKLRVSILLDEDHALGPMSEQHFLAALAALETAHRMMKIASYFHMRKD